MSGKFITGDRRIRKSKGLMKKALVTLMHEKDFKEISITNIVQYADLNRGTFYNNYQTKEDLLEELINDVMISLAESYRSPYEEIEAFSVSKLSSSGVKIFDHIFAYRDFYILLGNSTLLARIQDRIYTELARLLKNDIVNFDLPPTININLLANYQAYAIWGMIVEWINSGFQYTPAYMSEQLLAIVHNIPFEYTLKISDKDVR